MNMKNCKPRLLQLNSAVNWGSIGKIAEGIGLAAMERGWESMIAFGRSEYKNPSKSNTIYVGNKLAVYAHYARQRILDGEGLGSKHATLKLIEHIKKYNPDIIQLHNLHDHWLNYPILFQYLASIDIPIIWTFHDCWAFTGGCPYFDIVRCNKWKDLCCNCILRKGLLLDMSSRNYNLKKGLISKIADRLTIIPVSHWLEDLCNQSFLKGTTIKLIHNGIDVEKFKPSNAKGSKPLILGVAIEWDERKGFSDMMKLRNLLSADDIDIAMIGLNKKQIKTLPESIIGIERTQSIQELADWYSRAWFFVNPTYADNFPTVNVEALACGTPVITYNTGGSPEAIDENTGCVVEQGNVEELASAILHAINNPFSSEKCRMRAEQKYNSNTQFAKYIDIYESLI